MRRLNIQRPIDNYSCTLYVSSVIYMVGALNSNDPLYSKLSVIINVQLNTYSFVLELNYKYKFKLWGCPSSATQLRYRKAQHIHSSIHCSLHLTNRCRKDCKMIQNTYHVVAGAHNRRQFEITKQYRKVKKCEWWGYKDTKSKRANDIALLLLENPLTIEAPKKGMKKPLCTIGLMGAPVNPRLSTTATGWGSKAIKFEYKYSKYFIHLSYSTICESKKGLHQ